MSETDPDGGQMIDVPPPAMTTPPRVQPMPQQQQFAGNGQPPKAQAERQRDQSGYAARKAEGEVSEWEVRAREATDQAREATERANAATHRTMIAETASDHGLNKAERSLLTRMAPVGTSEAELTAIATELIGYRDSIAGTVKQASAAELEAYKAQQAAQVKGKSMQARPMPAAPEPPPNTDMRAVMRDPEGALKALEAYGESGGFISYEP